VCPPSMRPIVRHVLRSARVVFSGIGALNLGGPVLQKNAVVQHNGFAFDARSTRRSCQGLHGKHTSRCLQAITGLLRSDGPWQHRSDDEHNQG
jgi:hypothetical protein